MQPQVFTTENASYPARSILLKHAETCELSQKKLQWIRWACKSDIKVSNPSFLHRVIISTIQKIAPSDKCMKWNSALITWWRNPPPACYNSHNHNVSCCKCCSDCASSRGSWARLCPMPRTQRCWRETSPLIGCCRRARRAALSPLLVGALWSRDGVCVLCGELVNTSCEHLEGCRM